jgi:hypothetical protein
MCEVSLAEADALERDTTQNFVCGVVHAPSAAEAATAVVDTNCHVTLGPLERHRNNKRKRRQNIGQLALDATSNLIEKLATVAHKL